MSTSNMEQIKNDIIAVISSMPDDRCLELFNLAIEAGILTLTNDVDVV